VRNCCQLCLKRVLNGSRFHPVHALCRINSARRNLCAPDVIKASDLKLTFHRSKNSACGLRTQSLRLSRAVRKSRVLIETYNMKGFEPLSGQRSTLQAPAAKGKLNRWIHRDKKGIIYRGMRLKLFPVTTQLGGLIEMQATQQDKEAARREAIGWTTITVFIFLFPILFFLCAFLPMWLDWASRW
jgi:hypothetical protein